MVLEKKKKTFNVFVKIIGTSHMFFFFFLAGWGWMGAGETMCFQKTLLLYYEKYKINTRSTFA